MVAGNSDAFGLAVLDGHPKALTTRLEGQYASADLLIIVRVASFFEAQQADRLGGLRAGRPVIGVTDGLLLLYDPTDVHFGTG